MNAKFEKDRNKTFAKTDQQKAECDVLNKCSTGKRTSERVEDKLLLLGEFFYLKLNGN